MIRSGSAATTVLEVVGSRCSPSSAMSSPLYAVMVEGISFLGQSDERHVPLREDLEGEEMRDAAR